MHIINTTDRSAHNQKLYWYECTSLKTPLIEVHNTSAGSDRRELARPGAGGGQAVEGVRGGRGVLARLELALTLRSKS